MITLKLVDPNPTLCDAWREYFDGQSNVEIHNTYFEKVDTYDCMVSAANSFGLMDGGVDLAISQYFGWDLMRRVQERIIDDFRGEQPIGTSIIVETDNPKHPYVAHTPTMRIPMDISHTDNVYNAMWAMLIAVHQHNKTYEKKIESILCPGLGTGTGHVPYREAARQMSLAYKNFLSPPKYIDWGNVTERQLEIRMGGYDGFRFPLDEGKPNPPQ